MSVLGQISDIAFFDQHPDRQFRVRFAERDERTKEFRELGPHDSLRRRIIAWKVPVGSRLMEGSILCIPFLMFADETIRDDDPTLGQIVHDLMQDAAADYGLDPPRFGSG